jgi:hypothetical protein
VSASALGAAGGGGVVAVVVGDDVGALASSAGATPIVGSARPFVARSPHPTTEAMAATKSA